jgi:tRNA nucleotidyltransferase (CCA-adding enzyme)
MGHKDIIPLPRKLAHILEELPSAYVVGGSVRDALLGNSPKDLDIEVYDCALERLVRTLEKAGKVDLVGKSFGVIKLSLDGQIIDFSLPRRESKLPQGGHKAFSIEITERISPREAAARRDLTINSLAYNPKTNEILDFHGGLRDLEGKILRHTSSAFSEDPLRVLRVMQFAARFDFDVATETIELARSIKESYHSLAKERVNEEFTKMLLKGVNIRRGLNFLKDSHWIEHFPELKALDGCPQDAEWHPEGDVLQHTGYACNAMARLLSAEMCGFSKEKKLELMLAILCHDLGKPGCTKKQFKPRLNRVAFVSPGHDEAGKERAATFLRRIGMTQPIIDHTVPLVLHHMDHLRVSSSSEILDLAVQLKPSSIYRLGYVVEADHSGRPPLPGEQPARMQEILHGAASLGCLHGPQRALLTGQMIVDRNIPEGKAVGTILKAAYHAQIHGIISTKEQAVEWFVKNRRRILENAGLAPEKLVPATQLIAMGIKPGPMLGKVVNFLYELQLDGKLKTPEEALVRLGEILRGETIEKDTQSPAADASNSRTSFFALRGKRISAGNDARGWDI